MNTTDFPKHLGHFDHTKYFNHPYTPVSLLNVHPLLTWYCCTTPTGTLLPLSHANAVTIAVNNNNERKVEVSEAHTPTHNIITFSLRVVRVV